MVQLSVNFLQAAAILAKSGLSKADLGRLWVMADADRDGKLCRHEFAVAMHLAACAVGKDGLPLPATLPACLTPAATTVAATTSDGGEDREREVEGKIITVDDENTVVSSLGYPEGLSDIEEPEKGGDRGTGNNTPPRKKKSRKVSRAASATIRDSEAAADAPGGKRDSSKVGDGGSTDEQVATAKMKASVKVKGGSQKRKEDGTEKGTEKGTERDSRFTMSAQDTVRYGKAFDKLVEGKGIKNLGGKEVRFSLSVLVRVKASRSARDCYFCVTQSSR